MPDELPTLRPKNYVMSQGDIARCEVCPAARVFTGPKMPPHPGMWYGIFVHRFIQYAQERGRDAALKYVRSKSKQAIGVCERIDVSQIPEGLHEVGLTMDTATRETEMAPHDTAEVDRHIYARADVVFQGKYRPHVGDFKTGERSYDPVTSVQLLTIGCGVSSMYDAPEVDVSVINIHKDGSLNWHTHTHRAEAIDKHWKRMRKVHLEVLETRAELREEGLQPDFVPGEHCDNCRADIGCTHKRVLEAVKKISPKGRQ